MVDHWTSDQEVAGLIPGCYIAGTTLHCLVTEAHWCEQLANGHYAAAPSQGSNLRPLDR